MNAIRYAKWQSCIIESSCKLRLCTHLRIFATQEGRTGIIGLHTYIREVYISGGYAMKAANVCTFL